MKRNTLFGAAGLLVAGAAIGAGAIVSQNAMADGGQAQSLVANAVTMVNIGADGSAVQCTFTGADAEGLVPAGIPTDDAAKAAAIIASAQIVPADGSLPVINVDGGTVIGTGVGTGVGTVISGGIVTSGSFPEGAVPANGVITVGSSTADGKVTVTGVGANGTPIAGPETRDGTAEECAAMRADAIKNLADLQTQVATAVSGDAVISTSGGSATTSKP